MVRLQLHMFVTFFHCNCMMPRRYAIAQTATFTIFGTHQLSIRNKKSIALSRLPKINLIQVFFTSDIASTADLQETICNGFDLSCCCVSLTVDEMLHVNLRYHCDADIHLPKMQTTLLPCAFGAPSNCIHIQLERIFKYYKRGFRFLEAPTCMEHC